MTREEVKELRKQKRIKRAMRIARCRTLKNFLIWLTGMVSCVVIFLSAIFVGVYLVPISTYTGGAEEGKVSEDIASKSIVKALMNIGEYGMEDIPVLTEYVKQLYDENGLEQYVEVDWEKLETVQFGSATLAEDLTACFEVVASIDSTIGTDGLGEFGNLEAFTWQEVEEDFNQDTDVTEANYAVFYYAVEEGSGDGGDGGNQPQSVRRSGGFIDTMNGTGSISPYNGGGEPPVQPRVVYKKAFELVTEGDVVTINKVAPAGAKLYYANLAQISILEVMNVIQARLATLKITGILDLFFTEDNKLTEDNIIVKIFAGTTIGDLGGEGLNPAEFLDKLTIGELLSSSEGDNPLGAFGELGMFKWEEVEQDKLPFVRENGKLPDDMFDYVFDDENHQIDLYYFYDWDIQEYRPLAELMKEDGKTFNTSLNIAKAQNIYYANLAEVSISKLTTLMQDRMGVMGVVDLVESLGAGEMTEDNLIVKLLGGITVGDLGGEGLDPNSFLNKLTLKDLGGAEMLGDLGSLSVFSEWREIKNEEELPFIKEGNRNEWRFDIDNYNPKLYYVHLSNDGYLRMFNDDGTFATITTNEGTFTLDATCKVFVANLSEVPFTDFVDLLDESIGSLKVAELMNMLGANLGDDSLLSDVIGDATVSDLGSLSLNGIKLESVLGAYEDNKMLYDILLDAVGDNSLSASDLTIEHLTSNLSINKVAISAVLGNVSQDVKNILTQGAQIKGTAIEVGVGWSQNGYTANSKGYVILREGESLEIAGELKTGSADVIDSAKLTYEDLTIVDLTTLNVDNVALESVLDRATNQKLYAILDSAVTKGNDGVINISDLASLNINSIKLADVLPELDDKFTAILGDAQTIGDLQDLSIDGIQLELLLDRATNANLYKILDKAIDDGGDDVINVSDLSSLDINKIEIADVLPNLDPKIKKFLGNVTTIGQLGNLSIDNLYLCDMLDYGSNAQLYKVLVNLKPTLTDANEDGTVDYKDLKISDIAINDFRGLKLSTVISDTTSTLFTILAQATGKDADNVTVGDISGSSFSIDNVKLTAVLGSGNDELFGILVDSVVVESGEQAPTKSTITIGHLKHGFNFEGIKLDSVMKLGKEESLRKVLEDLYPDKDYEDLTLADVHGFDIGNVHLSTVIPYNSNTKMLGDILTQGVVVKGTAIKVCEAGEQWKQNGYTANSKGYVLLRTGESLEIAGELKTGGATAISHEYVTYADIKMSDLSNNGFEMSEIGLDVIFNDVDVSDSPILSALLKKEGVTIGNLATVMNEMSVSEIYNVSGFTTVSANAFDATLVYYKYTGGTAVEYHRADSVAGTSGYQTVENSTELQKYYIDKNASMWLFIMYEFEEIDQQEITVFGVTHLTGTGTAKKYIEKDISFGDMEDAMSTAGAALTKATIRQLIDAGVLESSQTADYSKLYAYTVTQAFEKFAGLIG